MATSQPSVNYHKPYKSKLPTQLITLIIMQQAHPTESLSIVPCIGLRDKYRLWPPSQGHLEATAALHFYIMQLQPVAEAVNSQAQLSGRAFTVVSSANTSSIRQ